MAGQYPREKKDVVEKTYFAPRLHSFRRTMESSHLDGFLFTSLENIRYLCGFTGSDGALVLAPEKSFFLTDSRYWTQSEEEVKGSEIVRYKKKIEGITSLLSDLRLKRIGFESASLTLSTHRALLERLSDDATLVPLEEELKNLRAVKDAGELDLLHRAIDISSNAFSQLVEILKEGVNEREAALEMEFSMKRNGANDLGFDIIIASGKRSALPHGKAGDKRIQKGDFILIDFGSEFQGYHSDQTRTLICGQPSLEQKKVYEVVKDAQQGAIEKVRPGVPLLEIDAAAREYIRSQGYGDYFGHGLGHGIGLAVHEDPAVNYENKGLTQEGMIFTVEPGVYIPDWGGVRIEDMVRVTSQGAELLTYLPRDLKVI